MLSDGPALLALLGGDDGLVAGLSAGDIVIDMGTTGVESTSGCGRFTGADSNCAGGVIESERARQASNAAYGESLAHRPRPSLAFRRAIE